MDSTTHYLQMWADSYRQDLIGNIMPFWLKHGLDSKHGGVYTCINRDGSLIDTTSPFGFRGVSALLLLLHIIMSRRMPNGWRLPKVA